MKKNLFILLLSVFLLTTVFAAKPEDSGNAQISMGEWKKNVYINDFLNIKYRLPDGWTRYSDEDIAEIMKLGTDLISNDQQYLAELAKLNLVYYMLVNNPATGDNIVVLTEKAALDYTLDYYLDSVKTQMQNLGTANYETGEITKEQVAGVEYSAFLADASAGNVSMTQKYYSRKLGKFFVSIIATSKNGEASINDFMKAFE